MAEEKTNRNGEGKGTKRFILTESLIVLVGVCLFTRGTVPEGIMALAGMAVGSYFVAHKANII